ncbi:MAG: AI-2E family transporter, partial [bacterium]|nr:AI-2E family transporter [bacterium]
VLVPKLMGAALKIHPVVILLSFLVGAKIAGIWGAFFAAPFIAVAVVIVREILAHYRQQTPVLSN